MIRAITNILNNVAFLQRSVAKSNPHESILFSTAVTYLLTLGREPTGWSIKRFRQRRGIAVFTDKKLVVKSSFFSPLTGIWLMLSAFMVLRWWDGRNVFDLFLAIVALVFIFQRRPFTEIIQYAHIDNATLGSVRGLAGVCPLLTITIQDSSVNLVTSNEIPEAVFEYMGTNKMKTETIDERINE